MCGFKSTFEWLHTTKNPPIYPELPWQRLWKLHCPPKLKIFLWQILNETLPTATLLNSKYILPPPYCSLCGELDDTTHCFLSCPLFTTLRHRISWINWAQLDFRQFFSKHIDCGHQSWSVKALFVFWHIWIARNNAIFRNTTIQCDALYRNIDTTFNYYISAISLATPHNVTSKTLTPVAWQPFSFTEFKLNTDRTSSSNT